MHSPQILAALVAGAVGSLLILIGVVTPGWLTSTDSYTIGLFGLCKDYCELYSADAPVGMARGCEIIAFLCSCIGAIVCLLHYKNFVRKDIVNLKAPVIYAVLFIITTVADILGVIMFTQSSDLAAFRSDGYSLGYSFALTITGGLLCLAAGVLGIVYRVTTTQS